MQHLLSALRWISLRNQRKLSKNELRREKNMFNIAIMEERVKNSEDVVLRDFESNTMVGRFLPNQSLGLVEIVPLYGMP